jgi:hypothetical protein
MNAMFSKGSHRTIRLKRASSLKPIFENSYVVESHLSEIEPRLVRVDEKGGTLGDDEDAPRWSLYSERAFVHYEIGWEGQDRYETKGCR